MTPRRRSRRHRRTRPPPSQPRLLPRKRPLPLSISLRILIPLRRRPPGMAPTPRRPPRMIPPLHPKRNEPMQARSSSQPIRRRHQDRVGVIRQPMRFSSRVLSHTPRRRRTRTISLLQPSIPSPRSRLRTLYASISPKIHVSELTEGRLTLLRGSHPVIENSRRIG